MSVAVAVATDWGLVLAPPATLCTSAVPPPLPSLPFHPLLENKAQCPFPQEAEHQRLDPECRGRASGGTQSFAELAREGDVLEICTPVYRLLCTAFQLGRFLT